jgi:hypothetical protein
MSGHPLLVWPSSGACGFGLAAVGLQQGDGIDVDALGDAFEAFEGEVAFAALYAAHVGAVDAEDVGECFLAEAAGLAVGAQVTADGSLQVALHAGNGRCLLLSGLQTYE